MADFCDDDVNGNFYCEENVMNYYILSIEKLHSSFLVLSADEFLYGWFPLACFLLSFEVLHFDAICPLTPVYSEAEV